jgi:hypothetical protein
MHLMILFTFKQKHTNFLLKTIWMIHYISKAYMVKHCAHAIILCKLCLCRYIFFAWSELKYLYHCIVKIRLFTRFINFRYQILKMYSYVLKKRICRFSHNTRVNIPGIHRIICLQYLHYILLIYHLKQSILLLSQNDIIGYHYCSIWYTHN